MFGQGRNKSFKDAVLDSIIGQQSRVEGDIHFSDSLHVDGVIKGNIIAEDGSPSVLTVSEHGSIAGGVQVAGTHGYSQRHRQRRYPFC